MKLDQTKLVPNANADDYYLRMYEGIPDSCKTGFVGYVGNSSNPDIEIKIEIDDQYMFDNNMISCCLYIDIDNYSKSLIVMTSAFFNEVRNDDINFLGTIWHEIGHFHTMHYFNTKRSENGSTNQTRLDYFNRREIMPEEKVADLFALYYTSKEEFVEHFNFMIKRRRENTWEDRATNDRAVAELARRKRFVNEMDCSEDNIRKMICELCGQISFEKV